MGFTVSPGSRHVLASHATRSGFREVSCLLLCHGMNLRGHGLLQGYAGYERVRQRLAPEVGRRGRKREV